MKQTLESIQNRLSEIKRQNLYRRLKYGKINGPYITINSKKLVNFCSNDYLGLSSTKITASQSQSSSRLVSGNDTSFMKLEKKLAEHKSQEAALVFPTGYMANLGAIPALVDKNTIIFSDELNHASIIEACKLSGAKLQVYRHNDVDDLEKKIKKFKAYNKLIITEGIFSMDGDYSKLREISEISQKTDSFLILDDAHGDFTVGKDGKGTPNHFGVEKKVDVYISSLSKGLGSFGGYATASNPVVDLCINKARSFIYTSALPSFLVEMSLSRIKQNRAKQQKKLEKNTSMFSSGLKQIGYDIKSQTHIIPIIIGNEKKTLEFGRFMYENKVFAQPIRYPTVPKNSARLRVSVTAWLEKSHIESALSVFERAAEKFKLV
ncbi:aminotransferase class I/II-fold pyridoxal phosphate-dependent enzyme [Candidatus Nitrosotenuis cloacae]|uniref:8-amino-7-oxononanoate synthase n=1 Tax=Candidatus Nitrosotenuis cloacae TaxID=1603555 RepID=A0A3G1AZN8_9ARCH|nr:pyridoxal phosphate-dependent aminotransferase family protein [Candidatus Nitrosotenuis cloacae]AJZ75360.1 8-amino-7-oxononanoate synthase [Candidatus Nitrosotenuis cloacae]